MTRRLRLPYIARILGLIAASLLAMPAVALDYGANHTDPIMTSPAAPLRQAAIVAPSPDGGAVSTDAYAYRDLLRRLGFEVTTIVADNRAELDGDLRQFAAATRRDGDTVVLVLGTALAQGKDLYVMPTADPPSRQLATSGVRLGDVLGRIAAHGPKDLIAIVDACRGADPATDCPQTPAGLPGSVSGLVAYPVHKSGPGPIAHVETLRANLLPLMTLPGLTFDELHAGLRNNLARADVGLAVTPSLSRTFAFLPNDFLARLPTACNQVDATADGDALRGRSLDGLLAACEDAAGTYDFSRYFADKLAVVREQVAFQQAVARCDDPVPTNSFLHDYPSSSLRGAVGQFQAACEAARRQTQQQTPPEPPGPTLVPRGDQQPSFSCAGTLREPVARLICSDADLAAADARLGQAFQRALNAAFDRRALAKDERDWLRRRDEACGIPQSSSSDPELVRFKPCLLEQINRRVRALGS